MFRRIHPSKFGGLSTNKANVELMQGYQLQLVQIYRCRRGGEVRTRGKEAGRWAFRFLARRSGASAEVQMKTRDGWWDGREVCGLRDSYRTLLGIFSFACLSHESSGKKRYDGWIPSTDFGFFFASTTCKHAIFLFFLNIKYRVGPKPPYKFVIKPI